MLGLGEYAKSWFYIEYSIFTQKLVLWIKGCQLFRKCMSDATDNKSFGPVLTAINEVRKQIVYMTCVVIVSFYRWLHNILYDI